VVDVFKLTRIGRARRQVKSVPPKDRIITGSLVVRRSRRQIHFTIRPLQTLAHNRLTRTWWIADMDLFTVHGPPPGVSKSTARARQCEESFGSFIGKEDALWYHPPLSNVIPTGGLDNAVVLDAQPRSAAMSNPKENWQYCIAHILLPHPSNPISMLFPPLLGKCVVILQPRTPVPVQHPAPFYSSFSRRIPPTSHQRPGFLPHAQGWSVDQQRKYWRNYR
jgi:hypothetical protein